MTRSNLTGRKKIFTWHVHGSYLYYLSQGDYDLYIPLDPGRGAGYSGRGTTFPFGENVIEIPAAEVRNHAFDCLVYQSAKNYYTDQYELFPESRLKQLPKIYLEHDPPREHPTDTVHLIEDPAITVVHVTAFNRLMWHNKTNNVTVIAHGVPDPQISYKGNLEKGVAVINNLPARGRRLGADIFVEISKHIPIDLVGMNSEALGGLGEIPLSALPSFLAPYRFFFNPIRYTSLGLAVCEAMMLGMPITGMATTEMVSVIKNNVSGFIDTDPGRLLAGMRALLHDPERARKMGENARQTARQKFDIHRFAGDWERVFQGVISQGSGGGLKHGETPQTIRL